MLAPGEVAEVNIGHHLTGNLFRAGHRLRAVVLPSFHPHFGLNPQTGARETDAGSVRRARITVLTGGAHRSEIEVPVVAGER